MFSRSLSYILISIVSFILITSPLSIAADVERSSSPDDPPAILTLTVYIQPAQVVNAGAKWRWKGENEIWSDWYNSGYTETEAWKETATM
jgi:hypothetical protein